MARNDGQDPNAGMSPKDSMGSAVQELSNEQMTEMLKERAKTALEDRNLDATMTMGQADAKRKVPRPRTDNLDERFARRIPADNAVRRRPSSRLKKRLSKQKQTNLAKQPNGRVEVIQRFTSGSARSREDLESVNQALAAMRGDITELGEGTQTSVRRLDRAIADYERENVGISTVYTPVVPPAGMTNDEMAKRFQAMAESGNNSMTFDRYVIADHSINQAKDNTTPPQPGDGSQLVFEYETSRGMYLGGSDSVADGSHILARGNTVQVLGVKTIQAERPDGTFYQQRVVQLRDRFDPDLRTTAK